MDRKTVLAKIPKQYHAAADELYAQGIPWQAIFALLVKILPDLLSIFSQPQPVMQAASCCPDHVKEHVAATAAAACRTHCEALAAACAAGCDC